MVLLGIISAYFPEQVINCPRFYGYESLYLPFTIDHHPEGYGLDPASRCSPLHSPPEQRTNLVSN